MSTTPTCPIKLTWAQRVRTILLTCSVMDAHDVSATIDPMNHCKLVISMQGPPEGASSAAAADVSTHVVFSETMELYGSVDPASLLVHTTGRNVYIRLSKRGGGTGGSAFWPRLLHDSAEQKRRKNISVDWNLWKDEDDIAEEAEEEEFASIGPLKAFTMSNGVNVNGGGDPDVVAKMLNGGQ